MIQENIIAYFKELISELSLQLQVVNVSQNPEAVHDTRVGIKRIRALIKLFNLEKENRRIKKLLRRELRIIFSTTGDFRNYDIQLNLVNDYEIILKKELFDIKEYLINKIDRKRKALRKKMPKKDREFLISLINEISAAIASLPDEKILDRIDKYLSASVKKLDRTRKHILPDDLHKQRKVLKEIRFCREMTGRIIQDHKAEEQIVKIKEVEDILGRWHDYNELKNTVEKFMRRLKKSKVEQVIKMNTLSDAVSNDIILLLDNYHKIIPGLDLASS